LIINENFEQTDLLEILLDSSVPGLESYSRNNPLRLPAQYRLAFRELGLSIGLRAVNKLQVLIEENPDLFNKKHPLHSRIETVMRHILFNPKSFNFWLEPTNREASSWTEHQDINMVMLATSLTPDGYLTV